MTRSRYEISKATAKRQQKLFQAFMDEIGARPKRDGRYALEIDTPLGLLMIEYPSTDFGSIMCRFAEPERTQGKLAIACNPYTGKWNFHPSKGTATEMLASFVHNVRTVMQTPC